MKITVRRSGGFAGPLLDKSFEFRPDTMPPNDAARLEALVAETPLETLHGQRFHARGGADLLKYQVTLETDGGTFRFFFDESAVPEAFRPVWEFLAERIEG